MAGLMKLACFVLACMIVAGPITANAALNCGTVINTVTPCIGYLTRGTSLLSACCSGVTNIKSLVRTPLDRQIACRCLKDAANAFPSLNTARAAGLPNACGVTLPYKISKSTNCALVG
ncbi:Non-specific lipid-transfer protein 2 [Hirschfeldia incana]|nr:Non-specific lipid-transfer protein 2 [Hirschfeldia incana]